MHKEGWSKTPMAKYSSTMRDGKRIGRMPLDGILLMVGFIAYGVVVHREFTPCKFLPQLNKRLSRSQGDGKTFPKNPKTDDMLSKLAHELVKLDADR